ncbi:nucleoside hydrolase [Paenibacillus sp. F411]|uniref:nucleoside hydrolase n=1 Tax=Paenibacillus sp. F411 TaxID=2820239 RepID=UPI001AAF9F0C|nr:nucleoside hydrolase [Paenibacillus sp. F411]MBO2942425.1 nucleoside hydrolase [Paenibacillus sp. F411]
MNSSVFPSLSEKLLVERLTPPSHKQTRIVMDTDTYNEIDDQFAVVYALLSQERIKIEALYAAPFSNELASTPKEGMMKSYEEILNILRITGREEIPVYQGSEQYLPQPDMPVDSEAAKDLVRRAMASDVEEPLYVVAIGAITNVVSAILMEPRIIERMVVIWLGGNAIEWPHTHEFNLQQDLHASRLLLDCGVPLVLIPCLGVASNLRTTLSELREYVKPHGELGQYLYDTFHRSNSDHYAYSRVIWDISVIAWLNDPDQVPSYLMPAPHISDELRWSIDPHRHLIRYVRDMDRDKVFRDLFQRIKLSSLTAEEMNMKSQ